MSSNPYSPRGYATVDRSSTLNFKMQTCDPKGIQSGSQSDNREAREYPLSRVLVQIHLYQVQNRRDPTTIQVHSSKVHV